MRNLLFAALLLGTLPASAVQSEDAKLKQRIDDLEKTVQGLQEKVQKLESTLMKTGGFTIVTNYTCTIATPFSGTYTATELSEGSARSSVIEQCKAKVTDQNQCTSFQVKCGK